ncbi:hypothetical protein [Acrocarpospora macrocephala]|uniref:hypothetical protein n=1 Tax=Acrocarpospora macrocephala TaxID=150177 RepID=UPI0012D344EB|nr:hypothetical protein [Acrocarpospora macrocephala]
MAELIFSQEMVQDDLTDISELVDLFSGQQIDEVLAHAFKMARGGGLERGQPFVRENGQPATAIAGAVLTADPAGLTSVASWCRPATPTRRTAILMEPPITTPSAPSPWASPRARQRAPKRSGLCGSAARSKAFALSRDSTASERG